MLEKRLQHAELEQKGYDCLTVTERVIMWTITGSEYPKAEDEKHNLTHFTPTLSHEQEKNIKENSEMFLKQRRFREELTALLGEDEMYLIERLEIIQTQRIH